MGPALPARPFRAEQGADVDPMAALPDPPPGQPADRVARLRRLQGELAVAALAEQLAEVDVLVGDVAAQQLVARLAVEEDGHLLAGGAHHRPHRVGGGGDHRLLGVPDPGLQLAEPPLRGRLHPGGVGGGDRQHRLDVAPLVDGVAGEDRGEGLETIAQRDRVGHVLGEQPVHHADDGGGIEASREAGAHRDVRHQPAFHRAGEEAEELRGIRVGVLAEPRRPVAGLVDAASASTVT